MLGCNQQEIFSENNTIPWREHPAAERIKDQSNGAKDKSNWISDISGSFRDDVEFDEILRLGREERQADPNGAKE